MVILEVSLISALMATGDAAPALMRDTLYSIIMIVSAGTVGFALLLGGRKFATQYVNPGGIKQYLMAIFPLAVIVLVFPSALPGGNFSTGQALLVALISAAMYGVFTVIQTKTHQSLFVYEHEDDDGDPHHGKPSSHSSARHAAARRAPDRGYRRHQVQRQSAGRPADQGECAGAVHRFLWRC